MKRPTRFSMDKITPFQLRELASHLRGKPVNSNTLRTWRNRIGIHADPAGYYSAEDAQLLGRYMEALASGRTTKQFLNEEYGHAN